MADHLYSRILRANRLIIVSPPKKIVYILPPNNSKCNNYIGKRPAFADRFPKKKRGRKNVSLCRKDHPYAISIQGCFEQVVKGLQIKCDIFVNTERLTDWPFGYRMNVTMHERRNTMDSGSIPGRSTQLKKPFPGVFPRLAG
jgi:hypothetical protein